MSLTLLSKTFFFPLDLQNGYFLFYSSSTALSGGWGTDRVPAWEMSSLSRTKYKRKEWSGGLEERADAAS